LSDADRYKSWADEHVTEDVQSLPRTPAILKDDLLTTKQIKAITDKLNKDIIKDFNKIIKDQNKTIDVKSIFNELVQKTQENKKALIDIHNNIKGVD